MWEADRPLTHTGRCCDPRGHLTDFTAKRIALPGVHERPIGLPHGLSLRPLTSDSQTDHMTLWWEAMGGLPWPPTSDSLTDHMWEALRVRSASHGWPTVRVPSSGLSGCFARGSDCIARCALEADRPPTSEAVLSSDWLRQIT